MFTNPLDRIRIASPCKSDWNEMYGDERRRFCGECKMNVYNLSGMTRVEAESLLINSEGRLCVRFYRRRDGTVLTKDCPVGWRAIKQRVRRTVFAFSSVVAGFFAGVFSVRTVELAISSLPMGDAPPPVVLARDEQSEGWTRGQVEPLVEWEGKVDLSDLRRPTVRITRSNRYAVGRIEKIEVIGDKNVVAWVK